MQAFNVTIERSDLFVVRMNCGPSFACRHVFKTDIVEARGNDFTTDRNRICMKRAHAVASVAGKCAAKTKRTTTHLSTFQNGNNDSQLTCRIKNSYSPWNWARLCERMLTLRLASRSHMHQSYVLRWMQIHANNGCDLVLTARTLGTGTRAHGLAPVQQCTLSCNVECKHVMGSHLMQLKRIFIFFGIQFNYSLVLAFGWHMSADQNRSDCRNDDVFYNWLENGIVPMNLAGHGVRWHR